MQTSTIGDSFNGGRHHISAVVSDPNIQITNIADKGNGFYKASLRKIDPTLTMNDKDFFPDDWDEFKILDSIKEAFDSKPNQNGIINGTFDGIIDVNGQSITLRIVIKDGGIHTAFPKL